MQTSDYDQKPKRGCFSVILNLLTALLVLGIVIFSCAFFVIYTNPYSPLNPFPPGTAQFVMGTPTPTATTYIALPPTWTPTFTVPPTLTYTPLPSDTPVPTDTPIGSATPTELPTATIPESGPLYELQPGSPVAITNIYHPELGCNWMGVGGQVVDMSNAPVTGIIIKIGGELGGWTLPVMTSLTGGAPNYGQAGYEFKLADMPIASHNTVWIQLLDQEGYPFSEKTYFSTYDDCNKNQIIINFKKVRNHH